MIISSPPTPRNSPVRFKSNNIRQHVLRARVTHSARLLVSRGSSFASRNSLGSTRSAAFRVVTRQAKRAHEKVARLQWRAVIIHIFHWEWNQVRQMWRCPKIVSARSSPPTRELDASRVLFCFPCIVVSCLCSTRASKIVSRLQVYKLRIANAFPRFATMRDERAANLFSRTGRRGISTSSNCVLSPMIGR